MYRRVLIPMGIAVGTAVGLWLLWVVAASVEREATNWLQAGASHWMLPVLPTGGWITFLAVFFAVRLCALRGGSRRECIIVGLAPLALMLIPWVAVIVTSGLSSLLVVLGITTFVGDGYTTLGSAVMVRWITAQLLGQAGTCVGATWLWFFVSKQRAAAMETGSSV